MVSFDDLRESDKFQATIDSENKLSLLDKLSQVSQLLFYFDTGCYQLTLNYH